jgi:hypothetical protein
LIEFHRLFPLLFGILPLSGSCESNNPYYFSTENRYLMGHEISGDPLFTIPASLINEKHYGEIYRTGFQFGELSPVQSSRIASFIQCDIEHHPR